MLLFRLFFLFVFPCLLLWSLRNNLFAYKSLRTLFQIKRSITDWYYTDLATIYTHFSKISSTRYYSSDRTINYRGRNVVLYYVKILNANLVLGLNKEYSNRVFINVLVVNSRNYLNFSYAYHRFEFVSIWCLRRHQTV